VCRVANASVMGVSEGKRQIGFIAFPGSSSQRSIRKCLRGLCGLLWAACASGGNALDIAPVMELVNIRNLKSRVVKTSRLSLALWLPHISQWLTIRDYLATINGSQSLMFSMTKLKSSLLRSVGNVISKVLVLMRGIVRVRTGAATPGE
jgi:hypothetical protein